MKSLKRRIWHCCIMLWMTKLSNSLFANLDISFVNSFNYCCIVTRLAWYGTATFVSNVGGIFITCDILNTGCVISDGWVALRKSKRERIRIVFFIRSGHEEEWLRVIVGFVIHLSGHKQFMHTLKLTTEPMHNSWGLGADLTLKIYFLNDLLIPRLIMTLWQVL